MWLKIIVDQPQQKVTVSKRKVWTWQDQHFIERHWEKRQQVVRIVWDQKPNDCEEKPQNLTYVSKNSRINFSEKIVIEVMISQPSKTQDYSWQTRLTIQLVPIKPTTQLGINLITLVIGQKEKKRD